LRALAVIGVLANDAVEIRERIHLVQFKLNFRFG
jgi:hypothetical protein